MPDGFLWGDKIYSSLSTIAQAITGTRWNGPRFFGLRMAVGANRRNIRRQFLIEALILALMGGLVGLLGAAAAIAIAWKAGWFILISPWTIVLACGFAGLVGISFGLYPAHRAARLDPIVALGFE